uniref:Uncharacterized protein n=1 Tax=Arion vulgaris TaxID=1028688 RepID=A0A0B6ZKA9_9EUPU
MTLFFKSLNKKQLSAFSQNVFQHNFNKMCKNYRQILKLQEVLKLTRTSPDREIKPADG